MSVKSRELRQKLGEITAQFRAIIDTPPEKRTAEQNASLDRMETDLSAREAEINRVEALERREHALGQPITDPVRPDPNAAQDGDAIEQRQREFRSRWAKPSLASAAAIVAGEFEPYDSQRAVDRVRSTPRYAKAFRKWFTKPMGSTGNLTPEERRDLDMGVAGDGGYTVPLEDFVMEIIQRLDEELVIRPLATKHVVQTAQTLGVPALAANPADADWTIELGVGGDDTTMAFGKREMRPWPVAKQIKVTEKLLRASPLGIEAYVRNRLAYIVGRAQAKAFNSGDGNSKPLGIYTADANGIGTGQDQNTNTSGAIDPDKVITGFYALRPVYWPKARWHMHPTWLGQIRKLKTTSPIAYLWEPGLAPGNPSTILGIPYVIDEYAPSFGSVGDGAYAAVCGDFSFYWIADALDIRIQRLDELYAATGQVGFIIRAEADAAPVLGEAFIRLKNS